MKKLIFLSVILLSCSLSVISQNIDDALRYSEQIQSGTGRFNSMAGAFAALGGDLSTLSQNPAGIGVYRSSEFSFTPIMYSGKSISYFKSNNTEDENFKFNASQLGVVYSFSSSNRERGLVSLNFGYSMNMMNNYDQSAIIRGIGNNSSMSDYWANVASNGYPGGGGYYSDELAENVPDTYLAWSTYLIDTASNLRTTYGSAFSNYGGEASVYGQTIKRLISNSGYSRENDFSIGANISDKLYLGATFGFANFEYRSTYQHSESVPAELGLSSLLSSFNYTLTYSNTASGFNFKLGAIYRPVESLRLAFAYHTPTNYRVDAYVSDNMSTYFTGVTDRRDKTSYSISNTASVFEYRLKTPSRALFGLAYQIANLGMVSVDYELVDYGRAKFYETGDGYDYTDHNYDVRNYLGTANNIRAGAEIRVSNLYFRGGYAYYGSPWIDGDYNSGKSKNLIATGLGFRSGSFMIDFSYSLLIAPQTYILYNAPAETAIADIDNTTNSFALTLGYRF
jgi:hypothetical protein